MQTRLIRLAGGTEGPWRITQARCLAGEPLPPATHLAQDPVAAHAAWTLEGVGSNERYVTRAEKDALVAVQAPLARAEADCAVLIPIRKSAAWWALAQDERRRILETDSRHIQLGLQALPAVARRLLHCRDLPGPQPFDFLTWFEFAAAETPVFDRLLEQLRATPEWAFVDREVELRMERAG